jgi:hypothetical protein
MPNTTIRGPHRAVKPQLYYVVLASGPPWRQPQKRYYVGGNFRWASDRAVPFTKTEAQRILSECQADDPGSAMQMMIEKVRGAR